MLGRSLATAALVGAVVLLGAVGCSEDATKPRASDMAATRIEFRRTADVDLSVTLDGTDIGRLYRGNSQIGRDVAAGNHHVQFRDTETSWLSDIYTYTVAPSQTVSITVGTGDALIRWQMTRAAELSNLRVRLDNANSRVFLYVDAKVFGCRNVTRAVGGYWLRKASDGTYRYVGDNGCGSNAPGSYLGRLMDITPAYDRTNYSDISFAVSYSCFPNRSPGAKYYGIYKLYDAPKARVTDVNQTTLDRIGPSQTVIIQWTMGELIEPQVESISDAECREVLQAVEPPSSADESRPISWRFGLGSQVQAEPQHSEQVTVPTRDQRSLPFARH